MIFIDEARLQKAVSSLDEKSAAVVKSAIPQAFGTAAAPEPVNVALEEMKATFPRLYEDLDAVEVPENPVVSFVAKSVSESRDPEIQSQAARFVLEAGGQKVAFSPTAARKADADPAAADLSKASSGPGKLKFTPETIDGVALLVGRDHVGQIVEVRAE